MHDQSDQERRKSKRYPFRGDIRIDGTKLSSSMDISEGGIYLSTIQYFEMHQEVEVSIPFNDETLIVKGHVIHFQTGIGMGIMFVDLSDEQRAKIKELIQSLEE